MSQKKFFAITLSLVLFASASSVFAQNSASAKKDAVKTTYGVGDRIDVEAGRVHEVRIGSEGCTYVIGE